jgi:hypothetical protein
MKKEHDTGYTSWWKHKRKYGKRVVAKRNRKKAKSALDRQRKQD